MVIAAWATELDCTRLLFWKRIIFISFDLAIQTSPKCIYRVLLGHHFKSTGLIVLAEIYPFPLTMANVKQERWGSYHKIDASTSYGSEYFQSIVTIDRINGNRILFLRLRKMLRTLRFVYTTGIPTTHSNSCARSSPNLETPSFIYSFRLRSPDFCYF